MTATYDAFALDENNNVVATLSIETTRGTVKDVARYLFSEVKDQAVTQVRVDCPFHGGERHWYRRDSFGVFHTADGPKEGTRP